MEDEAPRIDPHGERAASPGLVIADAEIDRILARHLRALGGDFAAYRGHVYRVLNYCLALVDADADTRALVALVAASHDLGIWTSGTFDYVEPSVALAEACLRDTQRHAWVETAAAMIRHHHKLRPYRGDDPRARLVEAFRRADLADLSWGLLARGWDAALVRRVQEAFPSAGFHGRICQMALAWAVRHPLRPLPMMEW